MSPITPTQVGNNTFNIVQASAMNQKKLMSLIGSRIALNSASAQVEKIDENMMYGVLLSLPENTLNEVESIVLWKTVKSGSESLVSVGDFQDNIHEYFLLLAKSIEVNLSDFFTYLDNANANARQQQKVKNP